MFDEPDEPRAEQATDPAGRAREKADEFRMHAELAAVFEGPRKFEAQILATLNADVARNVQRTIGKLLDRLGFSHISARPRHHAQNVADVAAFKKSSPNAWRRS